MVKMDISKSIAVTSADTAVDCSTCYAVCFAVTKTTITTLPSTCIQESADGSTWADVNVNDLILPPEFASGTAGNVNIGYRGNANYVKIKAATGITVPVIVSMLNKTF